jgi:iron complex transport system substrate-binding protein
VPFYTPEDSRPTFLSSIGMQNAPVIEQLSKAGQFYGTVSAERGADLDSDVFITYANKDSDAATFTNDKLLGQIPAIKAGHLLAATDHTVALAATIPSPLSIPYALDHFVPLVNQAANGA